ncbi:unnamed protein product, partial [Phaeothamnion confervicola]
MRARVATASRWPGPRRPLPSMQQGPHKPSAQIPEKDLHVAFERNSVGSWNVEGTGHNKFGAYTLSGLLEADGALEVYKVYLPKGQGIPRSPRGSSSSAIGGGGGLKRGRSDGVAAALARGSSSGGKGGGKQLARAVGGGALSTNNDYGTSAAGDDDGWGPAGGPLSADGMGPSPPGHARRVSRTPSHLVESDPLSEPLRKCMRVLQALMNVKGKSHWFTSPVDVVALRIPDYNRIIKTPMDLGTIKVINNRTVKVLIFVIVAGRSGKVELLIHGNCRFCCHGGELARRALLFVLRKSAWLGSFAMGKFFGYGADASVSPVPFFS